MPQLVNLPDGTQANFPDSMSQAEILGVLRKKFPPTTAPPQAAKPEGMLSKIDKFLDTSAIPDTPVPAATPENAASNTLTGLGNLLKQQLTLKNAGLLGAAVALPTIAAPAIGAYYGAKGVISAGQGLADLIKRKAITPENAGQILGGAGQAALVGGLSAAHAAKAAPEELPRLTAPVVSEIPKAEGLPGFKQKGVGEKAKYTYQPTKTPSGVSPSGLPYSVDEVYPEAETRNAGTPENPFASASAPPISIEKLGGIATGGTATTGQPVLQDFQQVEGGMIPTGVSRLGEVQQGLPLTGQTDLNTTALPAPSPMLRPGSMEARIPGAGRISEPPLGAPVVPPTPDNLAAPGIATPEHPELLALTSEGARLQTKIAQTLAGDTPDKTVALKQSLKKVNTQIKSALTTIANNSTVEQVKGIVSDWEDKISSWQNQRDQLAQRMLGAADESKIRGLLKNKLLTADQIREAAKYLDQKVEPDEHPSFKDQPWFPGIKRGNLIREESGFGGATPESDDYGYNAEGEETTGDPSETPGVISTKTPRPDIWRYIGGEARDQLRQKLGDIKVSKEQPAILSEKQASDPQWIQKAESDQPRFQKELQDALDAQGKALDKVPARFTTISKGQTRSIAAEYSRLRTEGNSIQDVNNQLGLKALDSKPLEDSFQAQQKYRQVQTYAGNPRAYYNQTFTWKQAKPMSDLWQEITGDKTANPDNVQMSGMRDFLQKKIDAATKQVKQLKSAAGIKDQTLVDATDKPVAPGTKPLSESERGFLRLVDDGEDAFGSFKAGYQKFKDAAKEIRGIFSPTYASPDATITADKLREAKATVVNNTTLERLKAAKITKYFEKFKESDAVKNISDYERTGTFSTGPEWYSEFFRQSMAYARILLQQAYGEDRVGYVNNYVRRAFIFGDKAAEAKGTAYLTNKVNSLSASTSPLRGRILDMPLDEALQEMRDQGINVKMATTNPELLRQWSIENARQALEYKKVWTEAEASQRIKLLNPLTTKIPDGMVPLEDRVAKVFSPTERGMVLKGQYYADKDVARIFNNAASRGLGDYATYRGLRNLNNAINQLQLGFSAFHGTATAINSGVSHLALALTHASRFELGDTVKELAYTSPVGVIRDVYRGNQFIKDLLNDDPASKEVFEKVINPSGARLNLEAQYQTKLWENMMRSYREGNYGGALARLPFGVIQKLASPLMEYAIPRIKIAATLDLAQDMIEHLPSDATPTMRARALATAADSIDNRFGQLAQDNLMWNKTALDISHLATRSLGWNLGTIREIGGAVPDVLKGKVTPRVLYTMALPLYVMTLGTIYQHLHTGQGAQSFKDYFYPQRGRLDQNGNPDRADFPTYTNDIHSYLTDPLGTGWRKAAPLLSLTEDLMTNKDYFGNMIREPEDPIGKQLYQAGEYAVQQSLPLSWKQYSMLSKNTQATLQDKVEALAGMRRAPSSVIETSEAVKLGLEYARRQGEIGPQSDEDKTHHETKVNLESLIRAKDASWPDLARNLAETNQLAPKDIQEAMKNASTPRVARYLAPRSLKQTMSIWSRMTDAEKDLQWEDENGKPKSMAELLGGKLDRLMTAHPDKAAEIKAASQEIVAYYRSKHGR